MKTKIKNIYSIVTWDNKTNSLNILNNNEILIEGGKPGGALSQSDSSHGQHRELSSLAALTHSPPVGILRP